MKAIAATVPITPPVGGGRHIRIGRLCGWRTVNAIKTTTIN